MRHPPAAAVHPAFFPGRSAPAVSFFWCAVLALVSANSIAGEVATNPPADAGLLEILSVRDSDVEIPCSGSTKFGFYLFARGEDAQLAVTPQTGAAVGVLTPEKELRIQLHRLSGSSIVLEMFNTGEVSIAAEFVAPGGVLQRDLPPGEKLRWQFPGGNAPPSVANREGPQKEPAPSATGVELVPIGAGPPFPVMEVRVRNPNSRTTATWQFKVSAVFPTATESAGPLVKLTPGDSQVTPPRTLPALHPVVEEAMIEWDWRLQDDLACDSPDVARYAAALERAFARGNALIENFNERSLSGEVWETSLRRWRELEAGWQAHIRDPSSTQDPAKWENLWRQVHQTKRRLALCDPSFSRKKVAFVKSAASIFSHQLTQYTGNCARPGGGVFVLESPGFSMACRDLTSGQLPMGSFEFCDVAPDGERILFSFCPVDKAPVNRESALDRFFHIWQVGVDGSGLRQLTDGPHDDFAAKYLPDGRLVFVSTRRGGFHRCGRGPCPVHTLTLAEPDGSDARLVSFHETQEWDPVPLWDGRILYTRWDYVDRNAVFYQQLWTVRSDGTFVQAYYGNNTFNPVGIWEARPIPGTNSVIATAAAHHAMTAGSIIRLDVTRGQDGPQAITRLTPDPLFPESEYPVPNRSGGRWFNPVGVETPPPIPPEQQRFPGHCYRTPYPLSETTFLVAYSYDQLVGEPDPNQVNMFGLYWMDVHGNKELLYRDLNISSLWPVAFEPRPLSTPRKVVRDTARTPAETATPLHISFSPVPPTSKPQTVGPVPAEGDGEALSSNQEGLIFLANVYHAWPTLPRERIARLRIVQVLPKSTWHANEPRLGIPNISPGKQVLGTVPVEEDGSAYFRVPAGKPLSFQALDELGRAVQIMRSITYVQPGETTSCLGCHEPRHMAPAVGRFPLALRRPPSEITPGPPGSRPFSYPLLVQPVLDRHCVSCHNSQKPEGSIVLTGDIAGTFTVSYNALVPYVPYSDWAGRPGDFRVINSEPTTRPDFFGARASPLVNLLLRGHHGVQLSREEWERLFTWMDCNALFYGTFNVGDQKKQQLGETIAGPDLE